MDDQFRTTIPEAGERLPHFRPPSGARMQDAVSPQPWLS
jgi:hypothetical protein